jgi:hypothetical protein
MNTAYEERSGQMVIIQVDRWIDNLRSDPRYGRMLEKMGFKK